MILTQGGPTAFGAIFAAFGVAFLLFSSVLTIIADRTTGTLQLEYRMALRRTCKQVPYAKIAGINVERAANPKRGFTYRLTVLQKDGQIIPFRSSSSTSWPTPILPPRLLSC